MTLYFYELDRTYAFLNGTGIKIRKCEAKERPKTYVPLNEKFFPNYAYSVRKEEIGEVLNGSTVILEKPDFELAKIIFMKRLKLEIQKKEKELERLEKIYDAVLESEEK